MNMMMIKALSNERRILCILKKTCSNVHALDSDL